MAGFITYDEAAWKDFRIAISGAPVAKIQGVKYKAKTDKSVIYGEGSKPLSVQEGNESYEGSIKVKKSVVDDLNRAAAVAGAEDIRGLIVEIICTYKAKGNRPLQVDTLVGVQFMEYEKSWDQGAKSMDIDLPIVFLEIIST